MRKARAITSVLTAAGITALTVTSAGAATSTGGVGSAQGSSSVFSLVLGKSASGSALIADLIGDLGSASNDPAAGGSSALSRLAGLQTASSLVPALNLQVPAQPVQAQSPNGAPSVSTPGIDLSNVAGVNVPASVATGSIQPAALTATLDSSGAHSGLKAGVSGIALAGGLVDLGTASTQVTDDSGSAQSSSVRSLTVGPLTVLSLGQLLAGLGIPLSQLPVSTLSNLLAALHLSLPSVPGAGVLPSGASLSSLVYDLTLSVATIDNTLGVSPLSLAHVSFSRPHLLGGVTVSTSGTPVPDLPSLPPPSGLPTGSTTSGISTSGGALTSSAQSTLQTGLAPVLSALGLSGINLTTALSSVTSLTALLNTLQSDLSSVLEQALSALDSAALLKVSGLNVGLTTKATNSVKTSVASLTGTVGSVQVGNLLSTPALNLVGAATQLSSIVNSLDSALGGVLGQVSPSLAGLVHVSLLTPVSGAGVSSAGNTVKAVQGVTALTATITPPAGLSSLVSTITSANVATTATGLLGLAGVPAATIGTLTSALAPIATLSATLNQTLGALANGAVLNVGTLSASSQFTPAPVPGSTSSSTPGSGVPTPGKLAFTGGNPVLAVLGGGGLVALLVGRRLRLTRRSRLA